MKKVEGRFYFKQTSNGNLIGEFSNDDTERTYTESADIITKLGKYDYIGDYHTTWYEDGACFAKLNIRKKYDSIFSLEWLGESHFKGEGMLCDNTLIGNYWSIDKDK